LQPFSQVENAMGACLGTVPGWRRFEASLEMRAAKAVLAALTVLIALAAAFLVIQSHRRPPIAPYAVLGPAPLQGGGEIRFGSPA
jgi:hypothetical protein